MSRALAIARVNVLRLLRDRSNIFFVFVFPLALVLVIGLQFGGGGQVHLALHDPDGGSLATEIAAGLEDLDGTTVDRYESRSAVIDAVARGQARGGVLIPPDLEGAVAAGEVARIEYVARQDGTGIEVQTAVRGIVDEQSAILQAARFAADETGADLAAARQRATALAGFVPGVDIQVTEAGESLFEDFENLGQFDLGASQQLMLFVFLTSLAGSAALIETRQLGIATRILATPTTSGAFIVGEALGRFGVALVQALYIMLGTMLIFGVSWGDPVGALAIVVLFGLVSAGAAMLMGAVFSNDSQAGGMGIFFGLGAAAIGGCMAPLEVFSPTMQRIAHATPHAWALDGFAELVRRDGGVLDILPELGVLAAFAAVLLSVAGWRLHRVTVRP